MRRPDMRRYKDGVGAKLQNDFQQIMTVQPENGPAVGMDIADGFQLPRYNFRGFKSRKQYQAMHFPDAVPLLIYGAYLPGYDKAGRRTTCVQSVFYTIFVLQDIQPLFGRHELFLKLFPPCRMCKIPGA